MNIFSSLFSNKTKTVAVNKNTQVVSDTPKAVWRNNMWVMTPSGIGIIFHLAEPCVVHLVDSAGVTVAQTTFNSSDLRQATYSEIPESRRGDPEKAARLGY